jgi:uncharacterized protein YcfL
MASYDHTQYSQIRDNPDHIYYDLTARSYASNVTDTSVPIRLSDTRSNPIINDISMYEMSIVRFQVDTFSESLPVLLFQTERFSVDPNIGIYTVTLEYNDGAGGLTSSSAENLIWSPQLKDEQVPSSPVSNPSGIQSFTPYYYVYNFQYFINLINEALTRAMDKLKALVAPVLNTVEEPWLVWNDNQTATLYARESHFDSDVVDPTPKVNIYFNRALYSILSSLPSVKFGLNSPDNKYYQILVKRYNGAKVVTLPNFGIDKLIEVPQEYPTTDQFTPISSIMFTTSTIPVIANQMSNATVYIDGQPNQLNQSYNQFANVLTDISSTDMAYKPSLLYVAQGEYRMISLMNNRQPLNQVDIEVFWVDKVGVKRAVFLPPNASVTLKLMFRKKKYLK